MLIGLASPRIVSSIEEGLEKVRSLISDASAQNAEIVCFPEAYLPGLRGLDFTVPPFDQMQFENALRAVCDWSRKYSIATVIGMEKPLENERQIVAYVIDANGGIQGYQTKNQ